MHIPISTLLSKLVLLGFLGLYKTLCIKTGCLLDDASRQQAHWTEDLQELARRA